MNLDHFKPVLVGLLLGFLPACGTIRDSAVYTAEIQFEDMAVRRSAPAVRAQLLSACSCAVAGETATWTATTEAVSTETCAADADWYRTYVGRWAWHIAMQRFNGGVDGATDPGAAPTIAHSCDLPETPNEVAAPTTAGGST